MTEKDEKERRIVSVDITAAHRQRDFEDACRIMGIDPDERGAASRLLTTLTRGIARGGIVVPDEWRLGPPLPPPVPGGEEATPDA